MKTVKIGKNPENDILLPQKSSISRNHCTITQNDKGKYILEDHSTNGTKVSGKLIKRTKVPLSFDSTVFIEGIKLPWLSYFKDKKEDIIPVENDPVIEQPKAELVMSPKPLTPNSIVDIDTYDLDTDYLAEYNTLKRGIIIPLNTYKDKLYSQKKTSYFSFSDELLFHAVESYNQNFSVLAEIFDKASSNSVEMQNKFDYDMQLLENLRLQKMVIDKQAEASDFYSIKQRKTTIKKQFIEIKREVYNILKEIAVYFKLKHPLLFDNQYETAKTNSNIWEKIERKNAMPVSTFFVGKNNIEFAFFDDIFTIQKYEYLSFLNSQNLIIRYNKSTKQKCLDFVNTLTGRLLASSMSGEFSISMIDTEEMDGTCDYFKLLNKMIFSIFAREEEIVKHLEETVRHIENIIQNVLIGNIHSLSDFNKDKENQEAYRLLVIEGFPTGISGRAQQLLKKILKNGVRAGVNVILLLDEDEIKRTEENLKAYNNFNIKAEENECAVYDFIKESYSTQNFGISQRFDFEILDNEQLSLVVQNTNKGFETRKEEVLKLIDYLLPESEWWSSRSANYVEIPFGISSNLQVQKLQITQEIGQNSAIVVGIPGSGKSVFLHSIIANAIVNYSPDELELFLMDFSGVEFNTYALHHLPHAKVIAPEAEREFGISVLRDIKEEGNRRMELCRNNDVSNIVDLRCKNPGLKIPRQLVIIDEFQKFFEIENDKISQEAQSIIEVIIREFRKFGINIILATQTLKGNPLDMQMIANRIVYKYSSDYAS